MNLSYVGDGRVILLSSPGRPMTDVAARFVGSEKSLSEIIATPYDRELVRNIMASGHKAATEFEMLVFGIEGYSRATETQLVRKRIASYMIKTGRKDKQGKRLFDMVLPREIEECTVRGYVEDSTGLIVDVDIDPEMLLRLTEQWYAGGVAQGYKEEHLRSMKQQATEFKAIVAMNFHALLDWFSIRCCLNAQDEIRDLANKMLVLAKEVAPDVFANAGPNCKQLGYCPEGKLQNAKCKGYIPTKDQVNSLIKNYYKADGGQSGY